MACTRSPVRARLAPYLDLLSESLRARAGRGACAPRPEVFPYRVRVCATSLAAGAPRVAAASVRNFATFRLQSAVGEGTKKSAVSPELVMSSADTGWVEVSGNM